MAPTAPRTRVLLPGGPADGRELNAEGPLSQTIHVAVEPSVDPRPPSERTGDPAVLLPLSARYHDTGSIRDDGTGVYRYAGQI
jgi:hypothetical protein